MEKHNKNKSIQEQGTAHLAETVKRLEKRVVDLERSDEERELQDDRAVNRIVRESREDFKAGRSRPAEELLTRLQAKKR
jgi:hypothetical protein